MFVFDAFTPILPVVRPAHGFEGMARPAGVWLGLHFLGACALLSFIRRAMHARMHSGACGVSKHFEPTIVDFMLPHEGET